MQEKRQPVLRLPCSYSGPGSSLRGWNACRVGRNDALSPSPDMDRESAYGAETLDRMPDIRPYMDRNPTCEVGTPSRIEGVMLFHQFRVSDVRAGICHPA